jgi:hypothetical protein
MTENKKYSVLNTFCKPERVIAEFLIVSLRIVANGFLLQWEASEERKDHLFDQTGLIASDASIINLIINKKPKTENRIGLWPHPDPTVLIWN